MRQNRYAGIQPPTEQMLRHPPRRYFALVDRAGRVQNYCGTVVYLWLRSGEALWFYIDFCDEGTLTGCFWRGGRWNAGALAAGQVSAYC